MLGQAHLQADTKFAAPGAVLSNVVQKDLFVHHIRDGQIQVDVKMLAPGAAPQVLVAEYVMLALYYHIFGAVDFHFVSIGGTLADAFAAHIAQLCPGGSVGSVNKGVGCNTHGTVGNTLSAHNTRLRLFVQGYNRRAGNKQNFA